jgi:hypothetical protein
MAKYKGKNTYAQTHFAHYQSRFNDFLAPALARLSHEWHNYRPSA